MAIILRCPHCEKHYEVNNDAAKQSELECALCGQKAAASDFSAMMFCPNCHGKLAVALDMLSEQILQCPKCNAEFSPTVHISLDDEDETEYSLFEEENTRKDLFKEGDFFDKYKIICLLGRGGMGEVYLAEHLFFHRTVALKIMLSEVAKNSVFAKRFIREAKLANKIESPNLISVFDVGIDSRTEMLFIAMEYVEGKNVSELIRFNGLFDEQTVLGIAYQVANVLKIMEEHNIVHRDIKPSNIMIDFEGNIKLADLGIAKSNNHAEGDLTLTQESSVFGTPNYASPEQCRSSHNVDTRSDIYSLGATMFHMVAGEAPYIGETTMEIMLKVLGDESPDFSKLNHLSAGFNALLYDMLQKDPAKRPQTVEELQDRIEKLFSGESVLKYKVRVMGKRILPILKKIGINILKAPLWLFSRKSDSAIKHFLNFVLFCFLLYLCGIFVNRHRDYLSDLWVKHFEKDKSEKTYENRFKSPSRGRTVRYTTRKSVQPEVVQPKLKNVDYNRLAASSRNTAPAVRTPAVPAVVYPATINDRVKKFETELKVLGEQQKNSPENKWLEARIIMLNNIRNTLIRQQNNQKKSIELRTSGTYDNEATRKAQELFKAHSIKRRDWGYNRNDIEFANELLEIVKNNNVDPNMQVEDGTYKYRSGSLLKSMLDPRGIPTNTAHKVVAELIKRNVYVDNNDRNRKKFIFLQKDVLQYGVDDLNGFLVQELKNSKRKDMINLLIECGANVNEKDDTGESVLHFAVRLNDVDLIRSLLLAGAEVTAVNRVQQTALFNAYKYSSKEIINLLLAAGSDAEFKNLHGKKAVDYKSFGDFNIAVTKNQLDAVSSLLKQFPNLANDELTNGMTPLQYAASIKNLELLKILLAAKADPEKKGRTLRFSYFPLQYVYDYPHVSGNHDRRMKNLELFVELMKHGANLNINPRGHGGHRSLLHFSMRYCYNIDDVHFKYIQEMMKYYDVKKESHTLLRSIFSYRPNRVWKRKDMADRVADVLGMLLKVCPDLSERKYNEVFYLAASNINVPENELEILLRHKINVNGKLRNTTALYSICRTVSNLKNHNTETMQKYVERIEFLLRNGADPAIGNGNQTIADLNLPEEIRNIPKIREFLSRVGK